MLGEVSREAAFSPPPVHLNIISGRGGLGDQICRLPAFRHLYDEYPHITATIWAQDYFVPLAEYLMPSNERRTWRKLSEAPYTMTHPRVEFNMERLTTLQLHLTDHAFLTVFDQLPPSAASRYLPRAERYTGAGLNYMLKDAGLSTKPYVVFTPTYTARSRMWPSSHINTLAKKLIAQGIRPVILGDIDPIDAGVPNDPIQGRMPDGVDTKLFLDLTNRTTLIEALGIIQRSSAVVGVDNGLLHLAHCTDVPVVMGFTTLDPKHRVPKRSVYMRTEVLEPIIPCKGCQSKGFAVNHDWRTCIYDDYLCQISLTADRFWDSLVTLGVIK